MLRTSLGLIASRLDLKQRVERRRTHFWKNRLGISVSLSDSSNTFVNPKKKPSVSADKTAVLALFLTNSCKIREGLFFKINITNKKSF